MDFKQRPAVYYNETLSVRSIDATGITKKNGNQNEKVKDNSTLQSSKQKPYELDYLQSYGEDITRRMVEKDRQAMTAIYDSFFKEKSDEDLYEEKKKSHLDVQTSFYNEKEITRQNTAAGISR